MKNQKIQICPACNRVAEIVWVHSHGQCSCCKTNIDPCCSGEEVQYVGIPPIHTKKLGISILKVR